MKRMMAHKKLLRMIGYIVAITWSWSLNADEPAKGELVLVVDGKPNAVIVIEAESAEPATDEPEADSKTAADGVAAPDPSKNQRAAQVLQTYIEKMSGARLPIVYEGQPFDDQPATQILVGHTQAAKNLGVRIPSGFSPAIRPEFYEEEGFVLQTKGTSLVVAGNNDGPYQGTVYAAYALLEQLGCRWYFPGEWGEIVPNRTSVTVPEMDVTSRPDFAVRNIWLSGWVPITRAERAAYRLWTERLGYTRDRLYPTPGDGYLSRLLPPAEYFETHPEYYAMNQAGRRHAPKDARGRYNNHSTMLCLSNPDVLTQSVENLRLAFAGEKKMGAVTGNGVGISPPDGAPYCYCPDCKAASQNFNYPTMVHRTMQSEEFFGFAAKLAREFPDKWVSTMAYSLREVPPQGVTLPPNIAVTYAPISSDVLHPLTTHLWRRKETLSILRQWRRLSDHVLLYDYTPGFLLGMWVPERDTANMAINVPIYKSLGLKGFVREGRKAFMQTWITYYICGKLFWDADADVAAIKQDFYTTFFGPEAGPHVQAWWDACEQALLDSPMQAHEDWLINHIYTLEFVQGIQKHVEAARTARMDDAQRGRFAAFDLIAQHLIAYAEANEAERMLDYHAAAAACQRMTDCKHQLNAIYSFFITVPSKPKAAFAGGRKLRFEELARRMDGTRGERVAELPLDMKFSRDRFNEGVIAEWYAPVFDDSGWGTKNTFLTWDQQDPPESAAGHDYDGYGWYRANFEVQSRFAGKSVQLYLGGALNEAWVWINGQYAGHRPHRLWWGHRREVELDVTGLIVPGQVNTVAIRVWNDAEIGGLYRRGFLWAENDKKYEKYENGESVNENGDESG